MIGKTNFVWQATIAVLNGDFEVVFVEMNDGVYIHYLKESAHVLDMLKAYPEIIKNAKFSFYEDKARDESVYFPNISLSDLLEKLGIPESEISQGGKK